MKQPTIKELLGRIAELENRIQQLEAQPREHHYHYHSPVHVPPAPTPEVRPTPFIPYRVGDLPPWGTVTIGDAPYWPNTTSTATWSGGHFEIH
jgi:hypothetical protein